VHGVAGRCGMKVRIQGFFKAEKEKKTQQSRKGILSLIERGKEKKRGGGGGGAVPFAHSGCVGRREGMHG